MTSSTRTQRRYDHRLRELVCRAKNVEVAVRQGVPRSTARGWLAPMATAVVTLHAPDQSAAALQQEVHALRRCVDRLTALLRLMVLVLKLSGCSLAKIRLPDGAVKARLLWAIDRARAHFSLRIVGLSHTRYHAREREPACALTDRLCCPHRSPQQLTLDEITVIREMVTSDEYRHVPTGTLARLAQRLGKVFASPSTWRRLVRVHRWRRPRQRVHPTKPKIGIRATCANEIWHIDTTLIRLLDGSRVYLRAVIDNFTRRILALNIRASFDPESTAKLLLDAARSMNPPGVPSVMTDSGVENFNSSVDQLVQTGILKRVLAQTDIEFSNSMIESWWRGLKHQWLYLNPLDTLASVKKNWLSSMSSNTTRTCPTPRSKGKRSTRCTLARAETFRYSLRLPKSRRGKPVWQPIAACDVSIAPSWSCLNRESRRPCDPLGSAPRVRALSTITRESASRAP